MIEVRQTVVYAEWFAGLRDRQARARIDIRVRRLSLGMLAMSNRSARAAGVSELRVPYGPGYRICFVQKGDLLIVLLAGGDKSTKDRDIRIARNLASEL